MADIKAPESGNNLAVPGTRQQDAAISAHSSVTGVSIMDEKDMDDASEKAAGSDVEAEAQGEKLEPVVSSEQPAGIKLFVIVVAVICSIFLVCCSPALNQERV